MIDYEIPFEAVDEEDFVAIPEGKYHAEIIEAQIIPTKDNLNSPPVIGEPSKDGDFYALIIFRILESPYNGRRVAGRFNIKNKNNQAQTIANSQITRIYRILSLQPPHKTISNTKLQLLLNKPFVLKIKVETYTYTDKEGARKEGQKNKPTWYYELPQNAVLDQEEQDFVNEYDDGSKRESQDDIPFWYKVVRFFY